MFTIHLKDLLFVARHGLYEEEKILGNHFVVNVWVRFQEWVSKPEQLDDTINYEVLFSLIQHAMQQPTELLETVAVTISDTIRSRYPQVVGLRVQLEKKNPPIAGWNGQVTLTHDWPQNSLNQF